MDGVEESAQEAIHLQKLADKMNIPFHMKKLNITQLSGNLEEACRHARLEFFSHLCHQEGYQAVILGHHADDQSETVLKKVLEGRSLPFLYGMLSLSNYQGMNIWRPLLTCSKSQIRQWLQERGHTPFEDRTNLDKKFLRGRFRTQIIPELARDFGKEIGSSLCRISKEAEELCVYLDSQLQSYLQRITKGPFGYRLDLDAECPKADFEIRYLIRKVCENAGVRLSHHLIAEICQKIRSKAANRRFFTQSRSIYIDRGHLFMMKTPLPTFDQEIPLHLGHYHVNGWDIEVQETEGPIPVLSGWKEAWLGCMEVQVPAGNYLLKRGDASLSKWWGNAKIPAFMRWAFPVIWSENAIFHEFLTKRRLYSIDKQHEGEPPMTQWLIKIRSQEPGVSLTQRRGDGETQR